MHNQLKFGLFDSEQVIKAEGHHLPHWFQTGAAIFITFRTEDSLPKNVIEQMQQSLLEWLRGQDLPEELANVLAKQRTPEQEQIIESLPPQARSNYFKRVNQLMHRSLDACHGTCPFRQSEVAKIVADCITFFDGQRYDLDCFVVMPNHAHAIVQFRPGYDLSLVGHSWLRYSSRLINKHIGRKGPLWQAEPFDHVIRSLQQFYYLRRYIEQNPLNAKLRAGEYYYFPPRVL
ncbi:MAG: transposase [Planctomycetaceae bacterium]|nr:transposase [Planctomycetaceae bacterium]